MLSKLYGYSKNKKQQLNKPLRVKCWRRQRQWWRAERWHWWACRGPVAQAGQTKDSWAARPHSPSDQRKPTKCRWPHRRDHTWPRHAPSKAVLLQAPWSGIGLSWPLRWRWTYRCKVAMGTPPCVWRHWSVQERERERGFKNKHVTIYLIVCLGLKQKSKKIKKKEVDINVFAECDNWWNNAKRKNEIDKDRARENLGYNSLKRKQKTNLVPFDEILGDGLSSIE